MATKFRFNYNNQTVDFDDYYVRSDIFTQGNLWNWGYGGDGQLGNNSNANCSSPVQTITRDLIWKQVDCGFLHSVSIKTDGSLWLWGFNTFGQLGNNTTTSYNSPIQTISSGNTWTQAAGGGAHTAAIKTDGTLWCWGRNDYGQLADNTVVWRSSPVQTISSSNNWRQVAGGYQHTAAIKTDGTLWLWGNNALGELGNGTFFNSSSSPAQTVAGGTNWQQAACSYRSTAAVKTDGTLWCWGRGDEGGIGNNTNGYYGSPVQTISGGTLWKQVACGYGHKAAIKTDGTLWTWGLNSHGQLGDNTTVNKSSPVQTITLGNNWKQVFCGFRHTVAVKTDGTIWCWGQNNFGKLGDNTTIHRSSPVQTIAGGTNWKQIACGNNFTAAITYIN